MHIFQYYVVIDQAWSTTFNDGKICDILAGPFHSSQDAEEWISSNPMYVARRRFGLPDDLRVVRAKVEVSLC